MSRRLAATLAVGTEVTDGQIVDRNSAWISDRLVRAGIGVLEHRAVADDRAEIERALRELSARVDLLFVTGGLGPTSDDFTRDVLADAFELPLEYDEASWLQIEKTLARRGVPVREMQRRQCYFPRGSRVLENTAGTANAFAFDAVVVGRTVKVYALPGPPLEIAAVWSAHLAHEIENLVPAEERETLHIFRCLGRPESEIAEATEAVVAGSGLRIGYRAHVPYVEVKVWVPNRERATAETYLAAIEAALGASLFGRDDQDMADDFLACVRRTGAPIRVIDGATGGLLHERVAARISASAGPALGSHAVVSDWAQLTIETRFGALDVTSAPIDVADVSTPASGELVARLGLSSDARSWRLSLQGSERPSREFDIDVPKGANPRSERARKFITEKALQSLVMAL